jgi:hypothetical protein
LFPEIAWLDRARGRRFLKILDQSSQDRGAEFATAPHGAYAREQDILSYRFLQDSSDLSNRRRDIGVAGYHDNTDTLIVQLINKAIGLLTVSQVDVNQSHIGGALGNHPPGVGRGCGWTGNIGSPRLKQHLQSRPDVPRILDDEDV